MALYGRLMRATMLEQRGLDYVTTARAKGLSEGKITTRHVLRNALLPVVRMAGVQIGVHLVEDVRGVVVAVDVLQLLGENGERVAVESAMFRDARFGARHELVSPETGTAHTDHRKPHLAPLSHGLQGREDLLVGKVPRRTKKHEGVGGRLSGLGHGFSRRAPKRPEATHPKPLGIEPRTRLAPTRPTPLIAHCMFRVMGSSNGAVK